MITADTLYRRLHAAYGTPRWWSEDPYTVMVQAVLVQHTAWSSVEKLCRPLADRLTPDYIGGLPPGELEALIAPCGFQKAKARTIRGLTAWFGGYGFDPRRLRQIPTGRLRDELLSIRGVGAETADVILVYAFYRPRFIVDAYTRRLLERLGCGLPDDEAIRRFFGAGLPEDAGLYGRYHWLILEHGGAVCKKTPLCGSCPLRRLCRYPDEKEGL